RYRSPAFHVQAWYDEVKDYTFPYPHECNPWCPEKCTGPMCTHYTQIVWATTNKIGCAVNVCKQMNVWGEVWENAVYLVCNYSPKGNWIGEAPYKTGRPCSECPPSYGGGCQNNLCYK
ncbi:CRLD2 protein, partial [Brachypteracias leptosomus]|nr:CRLD2 protein [Brachypteracias leptosomus]